ncbi:MAG: serine hydrolase [Gemmataceae bacterium]
MSIRCVRVVLLSALAGLGLSNLADARTPWLAKHRINLNALRDWLRGEAKGYRLVYLNRCETGAARFIAVAVKNEKNHKWFWHLGPLDIVQQKDAEYRAKGFRPICVSGYLGTNTPAFAVIWVHDGRPAREKLALNLTVSEYEARIALERKNDLMPSTVTGYADGAGSYRFTALFVHAEAPWEERHDLTREQYQQAIDEWGGKGYRPRSVTAYPTSAGLRFALVLVKDEVKWYARHGLDSERCQIELNRMDKEGFRPLCICPYLDRTLAGPAIFDDKMRKFMAARGIPAATLAVSRDGKLLLTRGYGFADLEGSRRIQPDDPMRIASLTKSITAAAIRKLVREGKLSLDAKVFPLLGLKPPTGQKPDPRLNDITIQHLLQHKGGWDSKQTFDPMFRPLEIAAALQGPGPAGPVDIIRHMMGQPLQFDPGSKVSYSNFGYCVLGRVVEKVSDLTYFAYVQKNIFAPLGAQSVELGRSLPKYRNPHEPVYRHAGKGRNVLDPRSKEKVALPDGTFYLEAMDSHGGLIASSRDVLRFLDAYWPTGEPRHENGRGYVFFGKLPGTFTMAMQRPNGVNVAALFNQSADPSGRDYFEIHNLMQEAADRQTGDAVRYVLVWEKDE